MRNKCFFYTNVETYFGIRWRTKYIEWMFLVMKDCNHILSEKFVNILLAKLLVGHFQVIIELAQ